MRLKNKYAQFYFKKQVLSAISFWLQNAKKDAAAIVNAASAIDCTLASIYISPLVGVLTVLGTIISVVGDNTNRRKILW
jgi:phage gp36-like protein